MTTAPPRATLVACARERASGGRRSGSRRRRSRWRSRASRSRRSTRGFARATEPSRDRRRVAYLYRQGLFCGYEIHVRARDDVALRKVASMDLKCADLPRRPALVWVEGPDEVRVIDADPPPR